jgi:paraquat-inducible protein A
MERRISATKLGVVCCSGCGLVCEDVLDQSPRARCIRCGVALRRRRRGSIPRAWAFLLSAMILYVPANILPVMYTSLLGNSSDSTITGGIIQFWKAGSYGIALLIFAASVAVPCIKFVALALLLVSTQLKVSSTKRERAQLSRLLEVIGYWSMLDVLVVGWVTVLASFGALSHAEPRIGILFFGLMVVLTMLSSINFDPRLIWDSQNK